MAREKSRREVLLNSAAVAALFAAPTLARSKEGESTVGPIQGGTNPIVTGPKGGYADSGTGKTVDLTVRPCSKDAATDVYNIRIVEASAVKRAGVLGIELVQKGIEGLDGGEQYTYFKFPVVGGVLQDKVVTFKLAPNTIEKVLTACVYGPDDFARSSTCTFILRKT